MDAFNSVLDKSKPTPYLKTMSAGYAEFNDSEVEKRRGKSAKAVQAEYTRAHKEALRLLKRLKSERLRKAGSIPWYGKQYSLDDFIVYANYAHKREHIAGLKQFRKHLKL